MSSSLSVTRFLWLRHGPISAVRAGQIVGCADLPCDLSDSLALDDLRRLLWSQQASDQPPVLVVSPLRRARDTAAALLPDWEERTVIDPDLCEQNFGDWTGQTWTELAQETAACGFWQDPLHACPPQGESFAVVCQRVAAFIDGACQRWAGRTVVVVCHAGAIRAALAHALGPQAALSFAVDPLSLTQIDVMSEGFAIGCVNRQTLSARPRPRPELLLPRPQKHGGQDALPPLTLLLGGARSGKSLLAEQRVEAASPHRLYLATSQVWDPEMAERVRLHQHRRDAGWETIEEPFAIAALLSQLPPERPVLLDCLTLWLTNMLLAERDMAAEITALVEALRTCRAPVVCVSNEVGLGIVPENALARHFRDWAGRLHQQVAAVADRVDWVAAGLAVCLKGQATGAVGASGSPTLASPLVSPPPLV